MISPSFKKNKKIGLISFTSNVFTFGLRSIESYLKELGYDVFIIHCSGGPDNPISLLNDFQIKALVEKCQDRDVVGISVISTHNVKRAQQMCDFLRRDIKAKVVLGGVPVILDPRYFLKFADYVCLGEGETFLKHFLETDDLVSVPGLGYKSEKGDIILNKLPPLVDINKLPVPRFDFKNSYTLVEDSITSFEEDPKPLYNACFKGYRIFSIRGCAFSCTYCANNKLNSAFKGTGSIIRMLDTELVMQELEYGKRTIPEIDKTFFMADDFTLRPKKEFEKFIVEYQKRIGLPFTFYSTVHSFTEEKLKILLDNKAKIIWMKLGLQTASERVNRDSYRRRFNKKAFLDKIELILSHNINLRLDMLLQNPYEETSDWAENIDFFYELGQRIRKKRLPKRKIRLNLFSLRFYPGTELYDRTLRDGIIDKDYIDTVLTKRSKYNFGRLAPYAPTAFSADLLLVYYYYMLMANTGTSLYRFARKPAVLGFLKWLCSLELIRFSYSFSYAILSSLKKNIIKAKIFIKNPAKAAAIK